MKREIKFRVWSKEHKKMLLVHDACFVNGTLIGAKGIGWDEIVEVMQFTGLLDRNGKEIYEGDILRATMGNSFGSVNEEDGLIVEFNEKSAQFVMVNDKKYPDGESNIPTNCTVIGNIYESPELLTTPSA